jgi:O-antigen/teichoic acid export membrane protein
MEAQARAALNLQLFSQDDNCIELRIPSAQIGRMSRFRRIVHSVASGYAVLAATAFYSLASVPLALHYLSPELFGLWTLMAAITSYLSLIDLGMSSSIARLLIDHKDDQSKGVYGSLIKTGALVLTVQGAIIFLVGFFGAPWLADWLHIEPNLRLEFIQILRWQCAGLAFSFTMRIGSHLLYAHQRIDVANYSQIGMFLVNFVLLWVFFHEKSGVFSLVWAGLISSFLSVVVIFVACVKLKLFPAPDAWGRISWRHFKEVFRYGSDLFVLSIGVQMIMMSQSMIVTRTLGLAMAAEWNVGTKMFTLLSQLTWSIVRTSVPTLSEMIVRKEQTRVRERYQDIFILSLSLSGFAAVSLAMCNSLFVPFFSHHKFSWPVTNDLLLGILLVISTAQACHNNFVILTKKIDWLRYVYFVEGMVFVCLALWLAPVGGLPAIISSSIFCTMLFSGLYGLRRMSKYLDLSLWEIGVRWLQPMSWLLLFLAPLAAAIWFATGKLENSLDRLMIHVIFCGVIGTPLFLRFGLTKRIQSELLARLPQPISPILRRVFAISK